MSRSLLTVLVSLLLTATLGPAQTLLAGIRSANGNLFRSARNFVCTEQIDRFSSNPDSSEPRRIDTITLRVSFETGSEEYTAISQNAQPRQRISDIGGAWSSGEFGTLLRQTIDLLASQSLTFLRDEDLEGTPVALYTVESPPQSRLWTLDVLSRTYPLAFRSALWISRDTHQILKIERSSLHLPGRIGIDNIRWSVRLQPVDVSGQLWLLPVTAQYVVTYARGHHREWNIVTFSHYRRYSSEATLHFNE